MEALHCLVYLDDVIIHSKSIEEHIQHVDQILGTLARAGVSLKLKKCRFFTSTVKYLGHIIKPGTLEIDKAAVASLQEARPPETQSEIRSFLGMCNVYRRFIPKFSDTAEPLNALLRGGHPTQIAKWGEKEERSFRTLLNAVCSPPVLVLPKKDFPYTVDTDASDYQVGCALFQTQPDGKRQPIGFWSRTLRGPERNYSASERECLAVVFALQTLRPYLACEKFTVYTDHAALHWLLNIREPSGRLMRWRLRLSEFDFNIEYKKGICNTQADALSRLRTNAEVQFDADESDIPVYAVVDSDDEEDDPEDIEILDFEEDEFVEHDLAMLEACAVETEPPADTITAVTAEEIVQGQLVDEFCLSVRRRINAGDRVAFVEDKNGILVRTTTRHPQIVVPHALRVRVLHSSHFGKFSGHPGGRKLYARLRRHFYWPSMAVDAYGVVRKCATCARNRIKLRKHASALKLFPARAPLEQVAIDILGELIKTPRGNRFLLVMTDRYTKLTKAVALKRITADTIAQAFVTHWVFSYGAPSYVLSDNGPQFTSRFFRETCRLVGASNLFTTTYHPRTNGQVERYNSTIVRALRHYITDHPRDWDLYADVLTYAYNCQPHSSSQIAPFELVLSNPPGPPGLSMDAMPQRTGLSQADFRADWQAWLRELMDSADAELKKAQERYKRNFDNRVRPMRMALRPGSYAFLRIDFRNTKDDTRHKLAPLVTGPHLVVSTKENTVVLEFEDKSRERVSLDRVVPAPSPPGAEWNPAEADQVSASQRSPWPVPPSLGLAQLPPLAAEPTPLIAGTLPPVVDSGPSRASERFDLHNVLSVPPDGDDNLAKTMDIQDPALTRRSRQPAEAAPAPTADADKPEESTLATAHADAYDGPAHVLRRIVDHDVGDGTEPSVPRGEIRYRVRWHGCGPQGDTWHAIRHLPRSAVLSYVKRRHLPLPAGINDAIDG